jgi:hypothetical protein
MAFYLAQAAAIILEDLLYRLLCPHHVRLSAETDRSTSHPSSSIDDASRYQPSHWAACSWALTVILTVILSFENAFLFKSNAFSSITALLAHHSSPPESKPACSWHVI